MKYLLKSSEENWRPPVLPSNTEQPQEAKEPPMNKQTAWIVGAILLSAVFIVVMLMPPEPGQDPCEAWWKSDTKVTACKAERIMQREGERHRLMIPEI